MATFHYYEKRTSNAIYSLPNLFAGDKIRKSK